MTIVAQACFDYIKLDVGAGLLVISNKYDEGLNEIYDDTDLPKVDRAAMDFLKICGELKINRNTEHVLSDYLYYKFNYVNLFLKRNFQSFVNDIRFSDYPRYPTAEDTVNNFHRFSKSWANKKKVLYDKAWNLKTQDKFSELKNLANKPFSSELLKMQDINKVEEKLASVWTKE
tara:strand:- start:186 stop:707 length:522 start_codon:yes stop_codon:yes gene_type:complete